MADRIHTSMQDPQAAGLYATLHRSPADAGIEQLRSFHDAVLDLRQVADHPVGTALI